MRMTCEQTVLPSLLFACSTSGHGPAITVPENEIEQLQSHLTSQPAVEEIAEISNELILRNVSIEIMDGRTITVVFVQGNSLCLKMRIAT